MKISNEELIRKAVEIAKVRHSSKDVTTGEVGCALLTDKGNIYLGVSIDACCGIGFCAEHSAIANMVTNSEFHIKKIVAVLSNGTILPPCGRCRELMYEISSKNENTDIIISKNKVSTLKILLPELWQKKL
jgi:cytidine deaminase